MKFLYISLISVTIITAAIPQEICETCLPTNECPIFEKLNATDQLKWMEKFSCQLSVENNTIEVPAGFSSTAKGDYVCCSNIIWGVEKPDEIKPQIKEAHNNKTNDLANSNLSEFDFNAINNNNELATTWYPNRSQNYDNTDYWLTHNPDDLPENYESNWSDNPSQGSFVNTQTPPGNGGIPPILYDRPGSGPNIPITNNPPQYDDRMLNQNPPGLETTPPEDNLSGIIVRPPVLFDPSGFTPGPSGQNYNENYVTSQYPSLGNNGRYGPPGNIVAPPYQNGPPLNNALPGHYPPRNFPPYQNYPPSINMRPTPDNPPGIVARPRTPSNIPPGYYYPEDNYPAGNGNSPKEYYPPANTRPPNDYYQPGNPRPPNDYSRPNEYYPPANNIPPNEYYPPVNPMPPNAYYPPENSRPPNDYYPPVNSRPPNDYYPPVNSRPPNDYYSPGDYRPPSNYPPENNNIVPPYTNNPWEPAYSNNYRYNEGGYGSGGGQCRLTSFPPDPQSNCCGRQLNDDDRIAGRNYYPYTNDPWTSTRSDPIPISKRAISDIDVNVTVENRIAGGYATELYQYPWTVLLTTTYDYGRREAAFNCGGGLISAKYVLTAAHCVNENGATVKSVQVNLAEYDKSSFPIDCKSTRNGRKCINNVVMYAEEIITHPRYESENLVNDIALLRLRGSAPYTDYIRPICLPTINVEDPRFSNLQFEVAGWGRVGQYSSNIKQSTTLTLVKHNDCQRYYPQLTDKHLCAVGKRGEDTCKGDSGGPLMILYRGRYYVSGIVSGKRSDSPCGTAVPSLYTNVYRYVDWIRSIIRN